jgi:hypothetical protein
MQREAAERLATLRSREYCSESEVGGCLIWLVRKTAVCFRGKFGTQNAVVTLSRLWLMKVFVFVKHWQQSLEDNGRCSASRSMDSFDFARLCRLLAYERTCHKFVESRW